MPNNEQRPISFKIEYFHDLFQPTAQFIVTNTSLINNSSASVQNVQTLSLEPTPEINNIVNGFLQSMSALYRQQQDTAAASESEEDLEAKERVLRFINEDEPVNG